ncbi:MAG TPA: 4-(cytidine 5'-diphospho)-2-C-methyl-D-erythritol kinase, partial [Chthoniobacterales bacterium]
LERPVFEKFLFLAEVKTWMRAQPECHAALMSGSGSTMFAVCEDAAAAKSITERATSHFGSTMWTAVCTAPV